MKNQLKNLMLLLSSFAICLFASCSDSEGGEASKIEEQNSAIQMVTENYLNEVVNPTYNLLATSCEELYNKISAFNAKLQKGERVTDGEIQAICDNYKTARNYWEESEAFLYGAASDYNIDPHIDTWPLAVETLKDILLADSILKRLNESDGVEYARMSLTEDGQLGFHGIEFIFFRDGKARSAAYFNNNEVESYQDYFKGVEVKAKSEVIYAQAVAGDLRDKTFQLEVCWAGDKAPASHIQRVKNCQESMGEDYGIVCKKSKLSYSDDLLAASTNKSSLASSSWKKVMEIILVSGCSNICSEVADQKMGQAWRCAHNQQGASGKEDDPNYIESPYSYNSFVDFYGNIVSIQNALYGNRGSKPNSYSSHSVMGYLAKYNPSLQTELESKLQSALKALETCVKSGTPFVKNPGADHVTKAIEAVGALDDELNLASNWILKN